MATRIDTSGPCPDWAVLTVANVNVAKDRSSFTTYTPFDTTVSPDVPGATMPVLGIGSVVLKTKRSPNKTGSANHSEIHLEEVLHVPSCICNCIAIGSLGKTGHTVQFGSADKATQGNVKDSTGRIVAFFDARSPLFVIKARGPALGPPPKSHLEKDGLYMIHVIWSDKERKRWKDYKAGSGTQAQPRLVASLPSMHAAEEPEKSKESNVPNKKSNKSKVPIPPYTIEEKQFLKKEFGGEFRFLRMYGLSIYDEEERDEGRSILRALMSRDEEDEYDDVRSDGFTDEAEHDGDDEDDSESEDDPSMYMADYNFTMQELEFIERGYGNSRDFMLIYGLKFYKDEDVQEAKAIVRCLMAQDEEDSEDDSFLGDLEASMANAEFTSAEFDGIKRHWA